MQIFLYLFCFCAIVFITIFHDLLNDLRSGFGASVYLLENVFQTYPPYIY